MQPRAYSGGWPLFCAPSCRTLSSARRLTVLPRPRTSRCLPMGRWPYRPHRSDACNEADKAHVCAQNVHSRAFTVRSGARAEFPELLYAAIRFLATSQPVATQNPNTSQQRFDSEILRRFIHMLNIYTPCSARSRHIRIPLNTQGALYTRYVRQQPQADCHKRQADRQIPHNSKGQGTMIKRPLQKTKVHIVHETIKKSRIDNQLRQKPRVDINHASIQC